MSSVVLKTINERFYTRNPVTDVLRNADSTPTITTYLNGSVNTFSLNYALSTIATGCYDLTIKYVGSVVNGDNVLVEASATVTDPATGVTRTGTMVVYEEQMVYLTPVTPTSIESYFATLHGAGLWVSGSGGSAIIDNWAIADAVDQTLNASHGHGVWSGIGVDTIFGYNGIDGTVEFKDAVKQILSYSKGKITKTGNTYTYYDTANNALFTLTMTPNDREVS